MTWFTDRDCRPQWLGHVPGYHTTMPPEFWRQTRPGLRTVNAAGLRMIEAVRCGTRTICRHRRSGACGRFIAWPGAWLGLYVDDVWKGSQLASSDRFGSASRSTCSVLQASGCMRISLAPSSPT